MTTENNPLENKLETNTDSSPKVSPTQNELDLEFNQMDPVIPKKSLAQEASMLDKAKGFVNSFSKNTQESHSTTTEGENNLNNHSNQQGNETPFTQNLKKPEKWAVLQVLPVKYRRIFIVLLAAIIILLIISWLKPNSETVQSFEEKTARDIPTQFQSLDPDQPMEPTISETLNTGLEKNTETNETTIGENTVTTNEQSNNTDTVTTEQTTSNETVINNKNVNETENTISHDKATEVKPSVPETTSAEKTTVEEPPKALPSKQQQQEMQKLVNKLATNDNKAIAASKVKENKSSKSSTKLANGKTLTIGKGKTLMQVFRDNHLSVADVNAMTKASGAKGVLSNFKPGDKIQVSVDKQGKVSELRLENGSRFIRQANGNYQFRK